MYILKFNKKVFTLKCHFKKFFVMLIDLFSRIDSTLTKYGLEKWWFSSILIVIFITQFISTRFSSLKVSSYELGSYNYYLSIFLFIIINNFFGLYPYSFGVTSHFFFIIFISLLFWLISVISSFFLVFQNFPLK